MISVHENIKNFIKFHNSHILDPSLTANYQSLSDFAATKNISHDQISIEKHRLPFINWIASTNGS